MRGYPRLPAIGTLPTVARASAPSTSTTVFRDPDEFLVATNIWGYSNYRLINTTPFRSELSIRNLGAVTCIRTVTTASITHVGGSDGGRTILVLSDNESPPVIRNGIEISANDLFMASSADEYCRRADFPNSYGVISMPAATLAPLFDGQLPSTCRIRPSAQSLQHLRQVHRAAMHHAGNAASLQGSLMGAVINCLATAENVVTFQDNTRTRAVLQFHALLENNQNWLPSLTAICATLGVNERTLRRYCVGHLGMGLHDYIMTHRLNNVRRALASADPEKTKIAEVAARYGFGDHSRFARLYRWKFGEVPSATLHSKKSSFCPNLR